jgi:hypothetical protein
MDRAIHLKGLTVLSLALCLATAAVWARSYLRCDLIRVYTADHRAAWLVETGRGRLQVGMAGEQLLPVEVEEVPSSYLLHVSGEPSATYPLPRRLLGLGWGPRVDLPPWITRRNAIAVPLGYLVVLCGVLPGLRALQSRRKRRRSLIGHCRRCGYDLRATPHRCPECGSLASPSSVAA